MKKIYYGYAVYDRKEISAVNEVLTKNNLTLIDGPSVKLFEKNVAKLFGKRFGLMVNSGSSANLLAIASLKLKKGSEIITPTLTFSTTVAPIYQLGMVPHFVDVEMNKFIINTEQIEKAGRDGFTWTDALGFIDEIFQIPGIIASGDEIGRELKDLTEAEKEELISYAVAEFDIPNDKVEAIVEDALKLAFTVVAMVVKWKGIKAED
jgi:hypothetical protein